MFVGDSICKVLSHLGLIAVKKAGDLDLQRSDWRGLFSNNGFPRRQPNWENLREPLWSVLSCSRGCTAHSLHWCSGLAAQSGSTVHFNSTGRNLSLPDWLAWVIKLELTETLDLLGHTNPISTSLTSSGQFEVTTPFLIRGRFRKKDQIPVALDLCLATLLDI